MTDVFSEPNINSNPSVPLNNISQSENDSAQRPARESWGGELAEARIIGGLGTLDILNLREQLH